MSYPTWTIQLNFLFLHMGTKGTDTLNMGRPRIKMKMEQHLAVRPVSEKGYGTAFIMH